MARGRHIDVPLSSMQGGLERRVRWARPDQFVRGLDVIADDGDLRRRDAFMSVAHHDPLFLPAGRTLVVTDNGGALNDHDDRNFVASPGGLDVLYVGVGQDATGLDELDETFDGFEFGRVSTLSGTWSANLTLVVQYWNGSSWTALPWFFDDTYEFKDNYRQPLGKTGRIAWHTDDLTGWATTAVNSRTGYWVRCYTVDVDGNTAVSEGGITLLAPGIRAFHLAPVRGLFPTQIEHRPSLIICADRLERRGIERGVTIAAKDSNFEHPRTVWYEYDRLAFVYGNPNWPAWTTTGAGSGGGGAYGFTAQRLTKTLQEILDADANRVAFDWVADVSPDPSGQWRGGTLLRNQQLTSPTTISGRLAGVSEADFMYEHCRLYCRVTGGGATLLDLKEILGMVNNDTMLFYDAFGSAPNATARFDVLAPPPQVLLDPGGELYEISGNIAQELNLERAGSYARDDDATNLSGWMGFASLVRHPRWELPGGERWTGLVDPVTGLLVMTNGDYPIVCDGLRVKRLEADNSSDIALQYSGGLADVENAGTETDPRSLARSKLRSGVPKAKYIVSHQGRFFLAGLDGRPNNVVWSAPGGLNNLWPYLNEQRVSRGGEENALTGLAVLKERLIAFTSTEVYEAVGPNDQGAYYFQPISQGVGFVHQNAVASVVGNSVSMLVGVSPDGIYVFDGSEPKQILEEWSQLIDGGINTARLDQAVAVAWPERTWVIFAVPSAGSQKNDRIIVWDYTRQTWWVWTARWGVSAMTVDRDGDGRSQLLVGTDDGFVQTMWDAPNDDGQSVDGYAWSGPTVLQHGTMVVPVRILLGLSNLGNGATFDLKVAFDENLDQPYIDASDGLMADFGGLLWGTGEWAAAGDYDDSFQTREAIQVVDIGIPKGAKAQSVSYYIGGTERWRLRRASMIITPKGRRGRR